MRCKRGVHDGGMQDVDDPETSEPDDEPGSTPERDRRTSASAPAPSARALSRDTSYSLLLNAPRGGGGGQRRNGLAFYSGPTGARGGVAGAYCPDSGDLSYGLGLGQLGALPTGVLASGPQLLPLVAGDGLDGALPPPLHALPYGGGGVSASLLGQLAAAAAAGTGERYPYGDGSEAWQDQVDPDEAEAATRLMALNPSHRSTGSIGAGRLLHLPAARAISLGGPGGASAAGRDGGGGIGFVSSSTPPPLPLPREQQRLLLQALNGGGAAAGIGLLGEELGYDDPADEYGHAGPYSRHAAAALAGSLDDPQHQQESLLALQAQILQQPGLLGGGRALSATGIAAAAAAVAQQQRLNSLRVKRQRGELDVDMQDVLQAHVAAGGGGALGLGLGQQQGPPQHRALSGLGALRLGGLALRPLGEGQAEAEAGDDLVVVDVANGPASAGGAAEWGRPPNRKTARLGGGVGGSGGSVSAGGGAAGAGGVPGDLQLQLQLLMLRQRQQQQQQNEAGAVPMQLPGGGGLAAGSPRLDLDLQADERYVQARADFGRRSVPSYADQDGEQQQQVLRRGGLGPRAAPPPGLVTLRPRADSGTRTVLPVSGGVGLEAQSLGGAGLDDRVAPAVMMLGGGAGGAGFQRHSDPIDVERDASAADTWERAVGGGPRAGAPLRGGAAAGGPRAASTGAAGNPSLMLPRDVMKHESGLDAIAAAAAAVAAAEDRDGGAAVDLTDAADARSQQNKQLRALQQQQQAQLTAALKELQEQQLAVEMHQQLQAAEQQQQQHRQHQQRPRDTRGGPDDEAEADRAAAMRLEERAPLPPVDVEAEERVSVLRSTLLLLLQQRRAAEAAEADAEEPGGVSLAPLRAGAAGAGTW
ncbi:hypothetical protein HYH02_002046 [Chlamydomonas schloesseri]|uniref:Uncharacterized protein n=1 Tax=Chlamydomonas schloesseri TaxID=2026947 RepID=A0A835WTC0_9CHLO|nr:hypothetical protein HYH02_002046 [Chlamydomonas schloesseri]|eukprot:KAG2453839.1 hypothetical protein HYH02_002046 [Chlamydomonas schloesseri]